MSVDFKQAFSVQATAEDQILNATTAHVMSHYGFGTPYGAIPLPIGLPSHRTDAGTTMSTASALLGGYLGDLPTLMSPSYSSPSRDVSELLFPDVTVYRWPERVDPTEIPDVQWKAAEYLRNAGWTVTHPAVHDQVDDPLDQLPRLAAEHRFPATMTEVRPEKLKFRFTDEDFD